MPAPWQRMKRADSFLRPLWILRVDSYQAALSADLPRDGYFTLLVASEMPILDGAFVCKVAEHFIQAGCCYMCAVGTDSGRIHDCFDESYCFLETENYARDLGDDENVLMTCGTDGEPIDEEIWFFLTSTCPTEKYIEGCNRGLILVLGGAEYAARVETLIETISL